MTRPTRSRNLKGCVGKRSAPELYQIYWKTRTALITLATRIYYRRDLAPHKFLPRPPPPLSQRRGPKNWRTPQYLESRWSAIVVIINDTNYSVRNAIWPCSQVLLLYYCVCSSIRLSCAWYLGLCL